MSTKAFEDGNRCLVKLVRITDVIEPDVIENVYHEDDLVFIGECEECIPLTEDFDVGERTHEV
jgi:hypothetical protein